MTEINQSCPKCNSIDAYFDGSLWNCPICNHEWVINNEKVEEQNTTIIFAMYMEMFYKMVIQLRSSKI